MDPFTIFVDGVINMAASHRSCGLKFGKPDASRPFNNKGVLNKPLRICHLVKFCQKKHIDPQHYYNQPFFLWLYIAKKLY